MFFTKAKARNLIFFAHNKQVNEIFNERPATDRFLFRLIVQLINYSLTNHDH